MTDQAPDTPERLRSRAVSAGSGATAATRRAVSALVESVGALADSAVDRVLLTDERVTSALEAKRLLEGKADTEALADKIQRVVVLAVPVVRTLARGARWSRVPWVMVASSSVAIGIAVRAGARNCNCSPRSSPIDSNKQPGRRPIRHSSRRLRLTSTSTRDVHPTRPTTSCASSGSPAPGCSAELSDGRHQNARQRHSTRQRNSMGKSSRRAGNSCNDSEALTTTFSRAEDARPGRACLRRSRLRMHRSNTQTEGDDLPTRSLEGR